MWGNWKVPFTANFQPRLWNNKNCRIKTERTVSGPTLASRWCSTFAPSVPEKYVEICLVQLFHLEVKFSLFCRFDPLHYLPSSSKRSAKKACFLFYFYNLSVAERQPLFLKWRCYTNAPQTRLNIFHFRKGFTRANTCPYTATVEDLNGLRK